eukprot:1412959-Rhodomonas_salina.1
MTWRSDRSAAAVSSNNATWMVACSQIRATRAFLSPVTDRPASVRITLRSATVYCRSTSSAFEKSGKGWGVSAASVMSRFWGVSGDPLAALRTVGGVAGIFSSGWWCRPPT